MLLRDEVEELADIASVKEVQVPVPAMTPAAPPAMHPPAPTESPPAAPAEPEAEDAAVRIAGAAKTGAEAETRREAENVVEALHQLGHSKTAAREKVARALVLLSVLDRAPTGEEILATAIRGYVRRDGNADGDGQTPAVRGGRGRISTAVENHNSCEGRKMTCVTNGKRVENGCAGGPAGAGGGAPEAPHASGT